MEHHLNDTDSRASNASSSRGDQESTGFSATPEEQQQPLPSSVFDHDAHLDLDSDLGAALNSHASTTTPLWNPNCLLPEYHHRHRSTSMIRDHHSYIGTSSTSFLNLPLDNSCNPLFHFSPVSVQPGPGPASPRVMASKLLDMHGYVQSGGGSSSSSSGGGGALVESEVSPPAGKKIRSMRLPPIGKHEYEPLYTFQYQSESVPSLEPVPHNSAEIMDSENARPAVGVRGGGGGMVMGTTRELNTMEQLLVQCATALEATDITYAQQAIFVVNNVAAVDGDPNQRLLAHFMRSLILRASKFAPQLLSGISEAHEVMMRTATTTTTLKTVLELTNYIDVMPWYRFGFIAANGAMLGAFEGKDKVHIVDFNVSHCMQWPTLIEALAERREGPPHVRLTVCVSKSPIPPLLDVPYADLVMRLAKFARSKSVPFEYALLDMEDLETEICIREGEALAVNCLFRLHYVSDEAPAETSSVTDQSQVARSMACPRDEVLAFIRSLNPAIVTLTEEDASLTSSKLVTRLRAAFNYLWIPFDALHTLLPGESQQRRHCEDEVASKIENLVACEGRYRIERVESKDKWVQRMRRARFEMVSFSEDVVAENKLMLGEHSGCWGLRKDEDEDVLFLTWKGHNVSFSTAWVPVDDEQQAGLPPAPPPLIT